MSAGTIRLTMSGYWREIEASDLRVSVKDQLKAMVSAWLSNAIPPTATPYIIRELRESGIRLVALDALGRTSYLEITEFIPDNPETGRSFTYLRPTYYYGRSRSFIEDTQPAAEAMIFVHAAVIEDENGTHHQFSSQESEEKLIGQLAGWVIERWDPEWGERPDDAEDTINAYFEKHALEVPHGFGHELWRLDPIPIGSRLEICAHCGRDYRHEVPPVTGPCPSDDCPSHAPHTYPIEIFCNGELSFKLDSEDAEGDMRAIKALMTFRTARRENRPLTDMELYGKENPHQIIHRDASGKIFHIEDNPPLRDGITPDRPIPPGVEHKFDVPKFIGGEHPDGCTFKKGDKDPCPTCPRLITALHSCGLLQDELHAAHGTGHFMSGGKD